MKKAGLLLVAFVTLFAATACNKTIESDNSIKLHASMMKVLAKGSSTDDSGVRDYNYASPLEIAVVRVDENVSGSHYPYFQNTNAPVTAVMGAPNTSYIRNITFSPAQYFRNDSDHIRFASWYPADSEKATYSTTEEQSTVTFKIDGATDIMYGSLIDGNKNDGFDGIVFNHALCQFNIYAYKMNTGTDGDDDDVDWGYITGMVVDKVQKNLILTLPHSGSDRYELSFPNGAEDLTTFNLKENGGIYWNPGSEIPYGFDSKEKVTSYLAAPPVGGYITLGISTSTRSPYQQISIARNFQSGCAYDIVLRFTSHGIINAEVSVGDWTYEKPEGDGNKIVQDVNADMYYDLSAYMTANSYIIPSGGYGYSFIGNVKGNSSEQITPGYIDILWSDNTDIWDSSIDESLSFADGGNYVQLASHHLSKNRIMVKVGDLGDADKELLHKGNVIIAAYDRQGGNILWTWHLWLNDSVGTVGLTNGYLIQNQDLGEVSGTGGLYYQWGRKDPFRSEGFTVEGSSADLATTIANPTVFYSDGDTWYNGNQNDMRSFWGWNADNREIAKSMYDPCPPGYHAPDYRMWRTSEISTLLSSSNGYLDGDGNKQAEPLLLWSASFDKAGTNPFSLRHSSSTGDTQVQMEPHRSYGGTIRCVAKSNVVVRDLSEAQTANSYIISGDGYYKFKADVAGNGVSSLITDKGTEWDMRGILWDPEYISTSFHPDRIDYLWYQPALDSAIPDDITTNDVCVKILNDGRTDANGYVNLEVENWQPGNVILAALDNGGTILWSWHLWLTEKPKDQGNGMYTIMDRNLGATISGSSSTTDADALATYGMYYQWGRKDPFPGPPAASGGTSSTNSSTWFIYNGGSWTKKTAVQVMDGPLGIRTAAQNPDMFIEPKIKSSQFVVGKDPQRWHWMKGYVENDAFLFNKALWGYAIQDSGVGIYPSKTMYDPCPPGYTVAHHWVFWNSDTAGSGSKLIVKGDFSSTSSFGMSCSKLSVGNYLPLSGRRNYDGKFVNNGTTGYLWGSTPKSGGRTMEYGNTFNGIKDDNKDWGYDQGYGQTVRCLKQ